MPAHAPLTADKPLTPKQEAFAQAVAAGASGPEANRKAGYSGNPNVSRVEAYKRLMKPNIAKRVRELQAKHAKKLEITAEGQFLKLEAAIKAATRDGAHSAVMQGIGLQNRLFGLEKTSTELVIRKPTSDPNAAREIELSTEEWMRRHAPAQIGMDNGFTGPGAGLFANRMDDAGTLDPKPSEPLPVDAGAEPVACSGLVIEEVSEMAETIRHAERAVASAVRARAEWSPRIIDINDEETD